MLLNPGGKCLQRQDSTYPDIRLSMAAESVPHHQDLNRLMVAWAQAETIVFHEAVLTPAARHGDIVLRDDHPGTPRHRLRRREPFLIAMKKAREPIRRGPRRLLWIFSQLAQRLGQGDVYTEGRDHHGVAVGISMNCSREKSAAAGVTIPPRGIWEAGIAEAKARTASVMLASFRADPAAPRSKAIGRIEIYSEKIASFATTIARRMPCGWNRSNGG